MFYSHFFQDFWTYGSSWQLILISILFVCLLLAAWKAPRWVKTIGHVTLILGIILGLIGIQQISDSVVREFPKETNRFIAGGFMHIFPTLIYSFFVYFVSLIIRVILKPRI